MTRNFMEMIRSQWSKEKFVCIGLDSKYSKIPECIRVKSARNSIVTFNKAIVDSTKDLVCAYKPNIAFYLAHGHLGMKALKETINYINQVASDVPVILDAKLADIDSTNDSYVQEVFEYLKADAVTVHPYLGKEALKPFLNNRNKGIIVLCRTSNTGAGEFQNPDICGDVVPGSYMPLYQYVAYRVSHEWNEFNNCMIVVGATYPDELREVRKIIYDMPILIPGIGAQGGSLQKTITNGKDIYNQGIIINSSRSIIFASGGPDFAQTAYCETKKLHDLINLYRN